MDKTMAGKPPPVTATFGQTPFSNEERQRIDANLRKPLAPEYLTTRAGPGGSKLSYIEGHKVVSLAQEIFGFDGWSHSIVHTDIDFVDTTRDGTCVSIGVSTIVRVTLKDGTSHEDVGYGSIENAKSKGMAFEKAKKESVTDGIKRALRSFGNALGNCVYDKRILMNINKMPKVAPITFTDAMAYRGAEFDPSKWASPVVNGSTVSNTKMEDSDEFDSLIFPADVETYSEAFLTEGHDVKSSAIVSSFTFGNQPQAAHNPPQPIIQSSVPYNSAPVANGPKSGTSSAPVQFNPHSSTNSTAAKTAQMPQHQHNQQHHQPQHQPQANQPLVRPAPVNNRSLPRPPNANLSTVPSQNASNGNVNPGSTSTPFTNQSGTYPDGAMSAASTALNRTSVPSPHSGLKEDRIILPHPKASPTGQSKTFSSHQPGFQATNVRPSHGNIGGPVGNPALGSVIAQGSPGIQRSMSNPGAGGSSHTNPNSNGHSGASAVNNAFIHGKRPLQQSVSQTDGPGYTPPNHQNQGNTPPAGSDVRNHTGFGNSGANGGGANINRPSNAPPTAGNNGAQFQYATNQVKKQKL
ncbi:DNA repair protein rad52 [Chytriomyces hyalinus]|nr:DNA repair protein rad52 [Chytriomyces hyalinus]